MGTNSGFQLPPGARFIALKASPGAPGWEPMNDPPQAGERVVSLDSSGNVTSDPALKVFQIAVRDATLMEQAQPALDAAAGVGRDALKALPSPGQFAGQVAKQVGSFLPSAPDMTAITNAVQPLAEGDLKAIAGTVDAPNYMANPMSAPLAAATAPFRSALGMGPGSAGALLAARAFQGLPLYPRAAGLGSAADRDLAMDPNVIKSVQSLEDTLGITGAAVAQQAAMLPGQIGEQMVQSRMLRSAGIGGPANLGQEFLANAGLNVGQNIQEAYMGERTPDARAQAAFDTATDPTSTALGVGMAGLGVVGDAMKAPRAELLQMQPGQLRGIAQMNAAEAALEQHKAAQAALADEFIPTQASREQTMVSRELTQRSREQTMVKQGMEETRAAPQPLQLDRVVTEPRTQADAVATFDQTGRPRMQSQFDAADAVEAQRGPREQAMQQRTNERMVQDAQAGFPDAQLRAYWVYGNQTGDLGPLNARSMELYGKSFMQVMEDKRFANPVLQQYIREAFPSTPSKGNGARDNVDTRSLKAAAGGDTRNLGRDLTNMRTEVGTDLLRGGDTMKFRDGNTEVGTMKFRGGDTQVDPITQLAQRGELTSTFIRRGPNVEVPVKVASASEVDDLNWLMGDDIKVSPLLQQRPAAKRPKGRDTPTQAGVEDSLTPPTRAARPAAAGGGGSGGGKPPPPVMAPDEGPSGIRRFLAVGEPIIPTGGFRDYLASSEGRMHDGLPEAPTIRNPRGALVAAPPAGPKPMPEEIDLESMRAQAEAARKADVKDKGRFEKLKKALSLPENRAEGEVAYAIRQYQAAKDAGNVKLEKSYPKLVEALPKDQKARVENIIRRVRDLKASPAEINSLPDSFKNLFNNLLREGEKKRAWLKANGYFSPAEIAAMDNRAKLALPWLHREYQAFHSKKFVPSTDARVKAQQYLMKKGLGADDAAAQVASLVKRIVDDPVGSEKMFLESPFNRNILKERKLPEPLRDLYGVINDPAFVVAQSAAELEGMYRRARVVEGFASPEFKGQLWDDKWSQGSNLDPRILWDDTIDAAGNKKKFGPLAGKYLDSQLRESMLEISNPVSQNILARMAQMPTNIFRFAKVMTAPATFLRNFIGNSMYASAAGVPMQRWPKRIAQAWEALRAFGAEATDARSAPARMYAQALEDAAVRPGRGVDYGGSVAKQIVETAIRESNNHGMIGGVEKLWQKFEGVKTHLGSLYETMDTVWRLGTYLDQMDQGVSMGLSAAEARSRATHIVNRYFASGASIGPAVKQLSNNSLGLAPFLSFHVDNMRVAKNIMEDAAKGQVGSLARTAVWWSLPSVAFAFNRYLNGISDEEVEAAEGALNTSWRENNPVHDWIPVKNADGKLTWAVSFDAFNPFLTFVRGQGSIPQRIAANVMLGFVESGALEPFARKALSAAGVPAAEYSRDPLPGQEGYALVSNMWDYFEPTLNRRMKDVARRTEMNGPGSAALDLRPGEEALTPGEAATFQNPLMPLGMKKVGPRTAESVRSGNSREARNLQRDRDDRSKRLPPDERLRVQMEAQRRLEELRRLEAAGPTQMRKVGPLSFPTRRE